MTTTSTAAQPDRKTWLLLDPPSEEGFARRGLLREKSATAATFPNIDLILLSGSIREAGYRPTYLDAQVRRWTWQRLCREATNLGAGGVISLISCQSEHDDLVRLGDLKRAMGGVALYTVAPISTVLDAQHCKTLMDEHPWLDGLILNTAEHNLTEVIRSPDAAGVNVALRRGDEVVVPKVTVNYEVGINMPMPEHAIFRDSRYYFPQSKRSPVTCVQMSFGCPFRCEFCLDNALYRKMRYRDVDQMVEELAEVDQLGFREVYFKDLTFGLNKSVTVEFLEKLAARNLRLCWLCSTRVDVTTPKLLRLMRRAGCYSIELGIESGLRQRRQANGKPISNGQIHTVLDNCRALGIETTALVMIGFEDETEEEIRETMRFVNSSRADYAAYNVVNALPGTPLERRARKEGFLRDEPNDTRFVASNLIHKHLTPRRLEELRAEAVQSFYRRPSTMLTRLARVKSAFELWKLVHLSRAAG